MLDAARGQTVYFNDWGGDARTNAFVDHVRSCRIPVLTVTHDAEDAAAATGPVVQL